MLDFNFINKLQYTLYFNIVLSCTIRYCEYNYNKKSLYRLYPYKLFINNIVVFSFLWYNTPNINIFDTILIEFIHPLLSYLVTVAYVTKLNDALDLGTCHVNIDLKMIAAFWFEVPLGCHHREYFTIKTVLKINETPIVFV